MSQLTLNFEDHGATCQVTSRDGDTVRSVVMQLPDCWQRAALQHLILRRVDAEPGYWIDADGRIWSQWTRPSSRAGRDEWEIDESHWEEVMPHVVGRAGSRRSRVTLRLSRHWVDTLFEVAFPGLRAALERARR